MQSETQIWVHVDTVERLEASREIIDQIATYIPDITVVYSAPQTQNNTVGVDIQIPDGAVGLAVGGAQVQLCLWLCDTINDALFAACHKSKIPIVMYSEDLGAIHGRSWLWRRTKGRGILRQVDMIFTQSDHQPSYFKNMGVSHHRIDVLGRLQPTGHGPQFSAVEREALQSLLSVRPIIFATTTPLTELADLLSAFAEVQRGAHRALLIIQPAEQEQAESLIKACRAAGYNTSQRTVEGEPTEACQIFVADDMTETGLWYSLAIVSVFGGTFSGAATDDPLNAASTGSAIIAGQNIKTFHKGFARLNTAGAVKEISQASELGRAVKELLASDIQAAYAHAGWKAMSEGADAINTIAGKIADILDKKT